MNQLRTVTDLETESFELAQRQAKALLISDLLPAQFKNNLGNVLIAMEYARRLDMPPLAIMQSLFVIHGRVGFDSKFFISQIVKRFKKINYKMTGTGDDGACVVWVADPDTGDKVFGPEVSIKMAKAEGWFGKAGSKWPSMPDLMLRYRAAAFFARIYLPDLLLGLQSVDEIRDVGDSDMKRINFIGRSSVEALKNKLSKESHLKGAEDDV